MTTAGFANLRYFCFFASAALFTTIQAQLLSTRPCAASAAVRASRNSSASSANAAAACTTFCSASNPQIGGLLYSEYCGTTSTGVTTYTATGTCGVTSYSANAEIITGGQTVVPTLSSTGSNFVVVPCSYGGTAVNGASLVLSNPGSTTPFYVNQQVVASSTSDFTPRYINVNGTTGALTTSTTITPPQDVTQTISFTLVQRGTAVYSNTVNITFVFQSCNLKLTCPTGPVFVCNNPPPSVPTFFPQLTCQVMNPPAGITINCDVPSNGGNGGTTTGDLNTFAGGTALNAPAVVSDATTDPSDNSPLPGTPGYNPLFIVNYNTQTAVAPPNGVCLYGSNTFNPIVTQTGCQYLRFSAQPGTPPASPFLLGFQIVQVCYSPTACP